MSRVSEKAHDTADAARDLGRAVVDEGKERLRDVGNRAGEVYEKGAHQARRVGNLVECWIKEKPLTCLAASLAIGVGLGLLVTARRKRD